MAVLVFITPHLPQRHISVLLSLVWVLLTLGVLISASTVFVKQHSMLDVLVAIPVSVVLCLIVYRPFPRNRLKQNA